MQNEHQKTVALSKVEELDGNVARAARDPALLEAAGQLAGGSANMEQLRALLARRMRGAPGAFSPQHPP